MQNAPFQPLARRLMWAIAFYGLAVAVLLCGLVGWWERDAALKRLDVSVRQEAAGLARSLPEAVWMLEKDLIKLQLETAIQRVGVGYVAVLFSGTGGPFVTVGKEEFAGRAPDVELALMRGPSNIGQLALVFDREAINREVLEAVGRAMAVSLALILTVLLIVTWVLRRHLQQPMQALAGSLEQARVGAWDGGTPVLRPARSHRDEIDLVMDALGELQARVAGHVNELDARVAERTEQLQMALDKLKILAVTDPLTGCHNRLAFSQKYPEAVAHAERYGRPLAVVFCDIDRFKAINDTHGHATGDRVLAAAGQLLREALRSSSDWVARYGGEEFVLVLPESDLRAALDVAERVRQLMADHVRVPLDAGGELRVTASFGVAQWQAGEAGERTLERADAQLYAAKREGRNAVRPALEALA